jgi:hypothetical protein
MVFVLPVVDTQNWYNSGLLENLGKPVRPVMKTGQDDIVKLSIGLHHFVDLVETIKMHI